MPPLISVVDHLVIASHISPHLRGREATMTKKKLNKEPVGAIEESLGAIEENFEEDKTQ